jgi:hypothetical protein
LIPAGVDSNLSVWARTAFEPSCDFAGLSFHVPTQFSPANAVPPTITVATPSSRDHTSGLFRIFPPFLAVSDVTNRF